MIRHRSSTSLQRACWQVVAAVAGWNHHKEVAPKTTFWSLWLEYANIIITLWPVVKLWEEKNATQIRVKVVPFEMCWLQKPDA